MAAKECDDEPSMEVMPWLENTMKSFEQFTPLQRMEFLKGLSRACSTDELYALRSHLNTVLSCDFLSLLPRELCHHLLMYLDVKSLLTCCQVCKTWNNLISCDDVLWKHHCFTHGYSTETGLQVRQRNDCYVTDCETEEEEEEDEDVRCSSATASYQSVVTKSEENVHPVMLSATSSKSLTSQSSFNSDSSNSSIDITMFGDYMNGPRLDTDGANTKHLELLQDHLGSRRNSGQPNFALNNIASNNSLRNMTAIINNAENPPKEGESLQKDASTDNASSSAFSSSMKRHKISKFPSEGYGEERRKKTRKHGSRKCYITRTGLRRGKYKPMFQQCHRYALCLKNGKAIELVKMYGHTNRITVISYYSGQILTGSDDHTVRIWDTVTFRQVHCIPVAQSVSCVRYNDDWLIIGSYDTTASRWSMDRDAVEPRACVYTGHTASIFSVDFSERLNRVVAGSIESVCKVWKFDTGEMLHTLRDPVSGIWLTCVRLYELPEGDKSGDDAAGVSRDQRRNKHFDIFKVSITLRKENTENNPRPNPWAVKISPNFDDGSEAPDNTSVLAVKLTPDSMESRQRSSSADKQSGASSSKQASSDKSTSSSDKPAGCSKQSSSSSDPPGNSSEEKPDKLSDDDAGAENEGTKVTVPAFYAVWCSGDLSGGCWILHRESNTIITHLPLKLNEGFDGNFLGTETSSYRFSDMRMSAGVICEETVSIASTGGGLNKAAGISASHESALNKSSNSKNFYMDVKYPTGLQLVSCYSPQSNLCTKLQRLQSFAPSSSNSEAAPQFSSEAAARVRDYLKGSTVTLSLASRHLADTCHEYRSYVAGGKMFDVFLCRSYSSNTSAYLRFVRRGSEGGVGLEGEKGERLRAGDKGDSANVIEIPLPNSFRENKRGTTLAVGARAWLEEGLNTHWTLTGRVLYALALPDNSIVLAKYTVPQARCTMHNIV